MTLVDRILLGEVADPDAEAEREIDAWVLDERPISAHGYLGMTLGEWVRYESQGRRGLMPIIEARPASRNE